MVVGGGVSRIRVQNPRRSPTWAFPPTPAPRHCCRPPKVREAPAAASRPDGLDGSPGTSRPPPQGAAQTLPPWLQGRRGGSDCALSAPSFQPAHSGQFPCSRDFFPPRLSAAVPRHLSFTHSQNTSPTVAPFHHIRIEEASNSWRAAGGGATGIQPRVLWPLGLSGSGGQCPADEADLARHQRLFLRLEKKVLWFLTCLA